MNLAPRHLERGPATEVSERSISSFIYAFFVGWEGSSLVVIALVSAVYLAHQVSLPALISQCAFRLLVLPFYHSYRPSPPGPSGLTAPYQLPHLPVLLLLTPVPMSPLSALTFSIRMRPYLIYPLTILNQFYHFNIVKHILHFIALGLAPFNNSYLTSALAVLTFVYFTIL